MKEIRISQETGQTISAANQTTGTIVTLRDLKDTLPDTRRVKTPTCKELRSLQPILQQPLEDGGLWVYPNGFAVYRSGRRTTVLRIEHACSHTYEFVDGDTNCSLNDQPWAAALVLYGEGRIEQNTREWDERRSVHYDGFDDYDANDESEGQVVLTSDDDIEAVVVGKLDNCMEQMLRSLTARQRQIVEMYYCQELTQQAIADKLGISKPAVCLSLQSAMDKLKNIFQENF